MSSRESLHLVTPAILARRTCRKNHSMKESVQMTDANQNQNGHAAGDEQLIAHCGLYCKACPSFKSGKCDGCRTDSEKSAVVYKSCQVKPCCIENGFSTCADCTIYASTSECKKYNPLLLKIASKLEGTDRSKSIEMIKTEGLAGCCAYMEERGWVSCKTRDSFMNKRLGKKLNE